MAKYVYVSINLLDRTWIVTTSKRAIAKHLDISETTVYRRLQKNEMFIDSSCIILPRSEVILQRKGNRSNLSTHSERLKAVMRLISDENDYQKGSI